MRQLWLIPSILFFGFAIDTIYHVARDYYRKLSGTLLLTEDDKQKISRLDGVNPESPERRIERCSSRSSSYAGSIAVNMALSFLLFANMAFTWELFIYTLLFGSITIPIISPLFRILSTRLGWLCFKLSHRKH